MVRSFILSAIVLSTATQASTFADTQLYLATGPTMLLRQGSKWHVGNLYSGLKPAPKLNGFRWLRPDEETCGVNEQWQVVCGNLTANGLEQQKILGTLPETTVDYERYCSLTSTAETYCVEQEFLAEEDKRSIKRTDSSGLQGKFVDLSGSKDSVCGLTDLGRIYCWGVNQKGRLGIGGFPYIQFPEQDLDWSIVAPTPPIPFPTQPLDNSRTVKFKQVSVYAFTSCALSNEGSDNAYCWGRVAELSNTQHSFELVSKTTSSVPRQVKLAGNPLEGLVAGPLWGAGWDAANRIYVWGSYLDRPQDEQLDLKAIFLMDFHSDRMISRMIVSGGHLCMIAWPRSAPKEEELWCVDRGGVDGIALRKVSFGHND